MIVMEALSREFRVALAWKLLYADDLVVIAENEDDDLIKRFNEWKYYVENRGMTGLFDAAVDTRIGIHHHHRERAPTGA